MTRNERRKRMTAAGSVVLAALVLSASDGGVGARPGVVFQQADAVPYASAASPVGDVIGQFPSVSGDGRYVAFHGAPTVADGATDARLGTVYLTDRESSQTVELTPVPDGLRSGDSLYPVISGDGCTVVAVTQMALDVFRDDDNGDRWDVYRSTLPHCGGTIGDWELISSRSDSGGLARDDVTVAAPTLSRSGTLVAYTHPADHLFDAEGVTTVSLVDVTVPIADPFRSRFVAGSPADSATDTFVHSGLDQPVLSGDGRSLAYRSDATSSDAVPGWAAGTVDGGPATRQVFVWDIAQPDPFLAVQLVSATPDGAPSSSGAGHPDISRDGTNVAFASPSTDLVPAVYPNCTGDCPSQVYALDRDGDGDGQVGPDDTRALQLVSAVNESDPLVAGSGPSSDPSISADGQLVAFVTTAADLQLIQVPGVGSGDDGDLLLAELRRGRVSRLTNVVGDVLPTQGVHAHPDLSDSGRTAVFDTGAAANLLDDGALPGRQVVARSSAPTLSLSDADLGTTLVGVQSDEWFVAVVNDGPSSFRPTAVEISDRRFAINEEKSTCLIASSVPAGDTCTVALTFNPTDPGPASGVLTVSEEGFGGVSVSSNVAGAGGNPALRIDPAGADLGSVEVGQASTEFQFDLSNVSFSPTEIAGYEISGAHAGDFAFTSNSCANRPVNPRASCSIGITFTPSDEGRRTAVVEIATEEDQYTSMVVAGDGEFAPVVSIDTATVDAGRDFVATGSQYPPNTDITIVFGDGPGSSVVATTDENGDFAVTVPVATNERGGDRTIVVQSSSGAAASTPVEVVETEQNHIGLPGFGLG